MPEPEYRTPAEEANAVDGGDPVAASAAGKAAEAAGAGAPTRLAVFDFDGTCINGNSPVLLVLYMMKRGMLAKSVLARIALWAAAYKLRLPQNESWVRGLVFSAFEGRPCKEVDAFLAEFYDTEIAPLFRAQADAVMRQRAAEGCEVVVVSATFEPIILRAMEHHPFDLQISTRMRTLPGEERPAEGVRGSCDVGERATENHAVPPTEPDAERDPSPSRSECDDTGRAYTREVEGLPVEGAEKVAALRRFADERFGEGAWQLACAYGDHHSDHTLLAAADTAFAVTPDRPLARYAHRFGWKILDWE